METKCLRNSILSNKPGGALFQKLLIVSIIAALLAAFLPLTSVFAAPATDSANGGTLEQEWANKLSMVRAENLFYAQVKLLPADYKDSKEMARPYELLDKYGIALKQANEIILKHAGFDKTGDVIDEEDATESVQKLAACLSIMNGMRTKLDEEGYTVRRFK